MNAPFTIEQPAVPLQVLPKVLDLAAAAPLHAALIEAAKGGAGLRLDASQVEILQLPCIQVLLAGLRNDAGLRIHTPSAAFVAAFEELGLTVDYSMEPCVPDVAPAAADTEPVSPDAGEAPKTNGSNMRILTIDDSKTMRDMLMLTLADAGFEVLQAVDGQEGVDLLRNESVDLIITDINMPRMDGYGVIRELRQRPEHKTTPILVLTTESELEKKNVAREVGATGWMVKPFDPDRLIATINKVAR